MQSIISKFINLLMVLSLSALLAACASEEKKTDTPEAAFTAAEELDKNERYDEAIAKYRDLRNRFPYSRFATMAELAVADVYFKKKSYAEAQASYMSFKDLHPKHPRADYVTYQLGMSYYKQLPSTIDRDLSLAPSAMTFFEEVYKQFPNSEYAQLARDFHEEARKKLAAKEIYIADFYFIRKRWDSALNRYEGLLKEFPGLGFDEEALSKAALSAARNGDSDRARALFAELNRKFPNSNRLRDVQREVQ
jgi:outer membrane protein assembly factor BamD